MIDYKAKYIKYKHKYITQKKINKKKYVKYNGGASQELEDSYTRVVRLHNELRDEMKHKTKTDKSRESVENYVNEIKTNEIGTSKQTNVEHEELTMERVKQDNSETSILEDKQSKRKRYIYGVPNPDKPGWITYPVLEEPYNREISPMCKKQIDEDNNRLEDNNQSTKNRNIILITTGSIIAIIIGIVININK